MALVTEAEAKQFLNITNEDPDLADMLAAAIEAVDYLCGPSVAETVTETVQGYGALVLRTTPVVSLTSVTGMSVGALTVANLWVDGNSGVVRPRGTAATIYDDWYEVVYSAGRSAVPDAVKLGCKIILKHQYDLKRGAGRPGAGASDTTMVAGYAIPNRALQIMDPYLRGPAVG